ncbi:MAG: helicase-related protein, partial [candidate division WOR-3 bacterium]|nr:helicase-related protein [candidate division WOR-3 bacterium]
KRNKIPLLVCTKAFGMGIDKPNIRYTIHLGIPHSIESFYQEAGRAGRDKKIAHCSIIVSNDDPNRTKKLLDPNTKIEEIESIIKSTNWEENDDITRALYFHTNTFRGIAQEKQDIEEVLKYLGDISKRREKTLTIPDKITEKVKRDFKDDDDINRQARELVEKALYRFLLIEVVSDYTIDYDKNEFNIKLSGSQKDEIIEAYGKYVKGYYLVGRGELEIEKASRFISLPFQEFVLEVVVLLLHFIYDIIERGRRSSLYEMLLACSNFPTNSAIRQRILRYLEATEYSENLEQLIAKVKNGIIIKTKDVFSIVRSVNDAAELRGQVSRYLESYPDHPGLLMLRALSEVYSKDKDSDVVRQNSIASISSALNNYGLDTTSVFEFSTWAISKIAGRDRKLAYGLIDELLLTYPNRNFARSLIEQVPLELAKNPANFLLTKLKEVCDSLVLERTE